MIPLAFSRYCVQNVYLFIPRSYQTSSWHDLMWLLHNSLRSLASSHLQAWLYSTCRVILHKVLFMSYLLPYIVSSVMVQVFIFVQFVDYFWFTCFTGAVFSPNTGGTVLECESIPLLHERQEVLSCPQCVLLIIIVILLVVVCRALVVNDSFTRSKLRSQHNICHVGSSRRHMYWVLLLSWICT